MSAGKSPSIDELTSSVADNGRRGMPRPGCDCVQCFGYCLIDQDKAGRDAAEQAGRARRAEGAPLDFAE